MTQTYSIEDLMTLMQRLRDPQTGCPWDCQQDYRSIAPSTLEEAYEVVDAIEKGDMPHLKEELGDLLFQVIFYSQLGAEEGHFTFPEIASDLVSKLVRRHPHVFPEGSLASRVQPGAEQDEQAIKARWEAIKQEEREQKGKQGVLDDVPLNFPALSRAAKLQKRAANTGFDWPDISGPLSKLDEETREVKEALDNNDQDAVAEELGDLLFSAVNVCRHRKLDPETVLRGANDKFERRFRYIESQLAAQGLSPETASLEMMDRLWDEAKKGR